MTNINDSELVTVTGGAARVTSHNNLSAVTDAVTALKSSMDQLVQSQANGQNSSSSMMPMMMAMMMRNQQG
ncbi:MAG TPA: hypothetical protein VGM39_06170 [Kofleriaceae bacterium]|jgi:hypothetical protein